MCDKKYLQEGQLFKEQTKLIVKLGDFSNPMAAQQCAERIAQLVKKDFKLIDTYIVDDEQVYILEQDEQK